MTESFRATRINGALPRELWLITAGYLHAIELTMIYRGAAELALTRDVTRLPHRLDLCEIAQLGMLNVLQWLWAAPPSPFPEMLQSPLELGSYTFAYLHTHTAYFTTVYGLEVSRARLMHKIGWRPYLSEIACAEMLRVAAYTDNRPILEWGDATWNSQIWPSIHSLIKGGNVDTLKWGHSRGWDVVNQHAVRSALRGGDVPMLRCLDELGARKIIDTIMLERKPVKCVHWMTVCAICSRPEMSAWIAEVRKRIPDIAEPDAIS